MICVSCGLTTAERKYPRRLWFAMRNGCEWCPDCVPEWVWSWRIRKQAEALLDCLGIDYEIYVMPEWVKR